MEEQGICRLPPETLSEIFDKLFGDVRSLNACLRVSRAWCRQVVWYLWSAPLRYGFVREDRAPQFIQSLINCLDQHDIKKLEGTGLKLPKQRQPFFDYASFIREFDFLSLDLKVTRWYYHGRQHDDVPGKSSNNSRIMMLTTQLSNLIISRSSVLTSFCLKRDTEIITGSLPDFTTFNGTDAAFRRLERVYLRLNFDELDDQDGDHVSYLLSAMKVLSRNIGHLEIDFHECTDSFERQTADLIRLQRGLRRVIFEEISSMRILPVRELSHQVNTLTWVEFRDSSLADISMEPLLQCSQLHTLVFEGIEEFPDDFWRPFLARPIRLRRLFFRDNKSYGCETDLAQFIQRIGTSLQELQLLQQSIYPGILHAVARFCPNFTHLDILVDPSLLIGLLHILSSCDRLTYLSIRREELPAINVDEFLPSLAEVLPQSVRHVNLYLPLTPEALSNFLRDCAARFLKIGLHEEVMSDNYLEVLADYASGNDASRDLVIGIDESGLIKCDTRLVERLKNLCRVADVYYGKTNNMPSF